MADQLDIGRMSLQDTQHNHGQGGFQAERSAYIPPHMRGKPDGGPPPMMDGPPPMMNGGQGGGLNGSAWGPK
jgi:ATP-dependent RNA helicase DDX3X